MVKESLTARERVVRVLNHKSVDRVPMDLGSHMSTGISVFAYKRLLEYLGYDSGNIWIPDMVQMLAYVDARVLERFHCDVMLLEPRYRQTAVWTPRDDYRFNIPEACVPERNSEGDWVIRKGELAMRMPAGGFFFDGKWLNDWGEGTEDERLALYAREAERIFKETDYATNFLGYSHGLGFGGFGGGSYKDAILAFDDPETLHTARKLALKENIRRMSKVIEAFGPYIQMVSMSDDMGTQNGPMCSPAYVEEFCMPYYKAFCDFVHEQSDIKVFLHSCGAVKDLMPMLIEAGIDVLNPVQISASGMNAVELKETFGRKIVFWGGGCNTQEVLGRGTDEQVASNVRDLMGAFKPDSGFVFNQVHNIMGNVPPENIVTMFDTAYGESFY